MPVRFVRWGFRRGAKGCRRAFGLVSGGKPKTSLRCKQTKRPVSSDIPFDYPEEQRKPRSGPKLAAGLTRSSRRRQVYRPIAAAGSLPELSAVLLVRAFPGIPCLIEDSRWISRTIYFKQALLRAPAPRSA